MSLEPQLSFDEAYMDSPSQDQLILRDENENEQELMREEDTGNGNDDVTVTITFEQREMLNLLVSYDIGLDVLKQLLEEPVPQEPAAVNVNGASSFAYASGFVINNGSFPLAGGDQNITMNHSAGGFQGGGNFTTAGQNQNITVNRPAGASYAEAIQETRIEAFQRHQLAIRNRAASSRRIQDPHQAFLEQSRSAYAVETYAVLPPPPINHSQLADYGFQDPRRSSVPRRHGRGRSLDYARMGAVDRRPVNIYGPNVLANASQFEFGEGVAMEPGAMAAVGGEQTIYQ
ncbi:hypothetical protein BDP27DRAFT_1034585 [Rhodocollybia butyracea]|uniref:Uncharacterized protein n=1 Tax=Rhodocollybia butyracea TaxID=206335 RepID=A0A9P5Q5J1_9AGAR|nr:hypothetical protein BDP27DRAFT_1034585 [Rhodocollybia butyracea]